MEHNIPGVGAEAAESLAVGHQPLRKTKHWSMSGLYSDTEARDLDVGLAATGTAAMIWPPDAVSSQL
jgi:LDH2 family malate/lactate/ureidoglycolate dehydrogenase